MEVLNSAVVILADDEYLVKGKTTKKTKEPNYFRVGNGTMNRHKIFGIDLLDAGMDATKAGQWLIRKIKVGITYENDYSPVVKISRKELTKSEQNYLDKGYAELSAKDLVRRIKQGHYMINPNALIPPNYDEAIKIWDEAGKKS